MGGGKGGGFDCGWERFIDHYCVDTDVEVEGSGTARSESQEWSCCDIIET